MYKRQPYALAPKRVEFRTQQQLPKIFLAVFIKRTLAVECLFMRDIFAVYFIIVKEYHVRRALLDFFAQSRKQLGRDGVVRIKDDEIVTARILKRSLSRERCV